MISARHVVFYSGRDWWASLMVWSIAIFCWVMATQIMTAATYDGQFMEGIIALLAGMAAPWFWLTTRYQLLDHVLLLKSGPFFKRIDYADIRAVKNGRKQNGVSFAFSMDCLQIDVNDSKLGYRISPREQDKFLIALANRCEQLVLSNHELVSRD